MTHLSHLSEVIVYLWNFAQAFVVRAFTFIQCVYQDVMLPSSNVLEGCW